MLLGVEIGGTKIQLGVGNGHDGQLIELRRFEVESDLGAEGILRGIQTVTRDLMQRHDVRGVGVGFGGPVDGSRGLVLKSHHVQGWDHFDLAGWFQEHFSLSAVVANDADTAGLAEARFGAGRHADPVFYITVGTGIGGGFILGGKIYQGHGPAVAELGHLRLGPDAKDPRMNLESLAAGWGIAQQARRRLIEELSLREDAAKPKAGVSDSSDATSPEMPTSPSGNAVDDLMSRCEGDPRRLTTKMVGQAASEGNPLAGEVLSGAWRALGWGIAQMITLLAPEVVVIGGGVSLLGEQRMMDPLRREVARYVFPPLRDTTRIVAAALGEEMVVLGALALAAEGKTQR
jgi:glucokinase